MSGVTLPKCVCNHTFLLSIYIMDNKPNEFIKHLREEKLAFTPPNDSDSDNEDLNMSWYPKSKKRNINKKPKNKTVKKNNSSVRKHKALLKIRKSVKIGGKKKSMAKKQKK